MPILKHAIKKIRVDKRRASVNKTVKTTAKKAIKSFRSSPKAEDLPSVFSALDRAAKKNIFHHRKADRLKSRLSKLVVAAPKTAKKATKKTAAKKPAKKSSSK